MTTGEQWLRSLDPHLRPVARIWVEMPQGEFQGRMALALADLRDQIEASRKPAWKSAAQWVGVAVASAGAALFGIGHVPR